MIETNDMEAHSKLLLQENQKSKKKRVSFSIFNANTLEEMEGLRKERERDLMKMVQIKNTINEHVTIDKAMNSTFTPDHRLSKSNPILFNEIVKVENIFLHNQSNSFKPVHKPVHNTKLSYNTDKDYILVHSEYEIGSNCVIVDTFNTNSLSVKSQKENVLFSEEMNQSEYIQSNDPLTSLSLDKNDGDLIIEEINKGDLIIINENYNSDNISINKEEEVRINGGKKDNDVDNIKEENKMEPEDIINHNNVIEIIEMEEKANLFNINHFSEVLFSVLFRNSNRNKSNTFFYNIFYQEINLINNKEKSLFFKTELYIKNSIYDKFNTQVKKDIKFSKYSQYNNQQANKFILYTNYNQRSKLFNELKIYAVKRRNWIGKIYKEIKIHSIWKCFDNWKLYVNYKIIKRYFRKKTKAKIFSAFKLNQEMSMELEKKVRILRYILISKNLIFSLRKKAIEGKNKHYNKQLSSEFYRSILLRKIFKLIFSHYQQIIESRSLIKDKINKKIKDSDYIKLKILQNHSTKITNDSNGNFICKKIIKNNIKII